MKLKGEVQYHILHANEWIKQLANSNTETIVRMQTALDYAIPFALGIFEKSKFEAEIIAEGVFQGEEALQNLWQEKIKEVINSTELILPSLESIDPEYGGRYGIHSAHLQPLLTEMGEVIQSDPNAEW